MSPLAITAPLLVAQQGDTPSPYTYQLPATGAMEPVASTATFDGSGAGGDFLAALSYRAQSGQLLSRVFPTTPVVAGDVAQVSYAPFPGGLASSSGGSLALSSPHDSVLITPLGPGSFGLDVAIDTFNPYRFSAATLSGLYNAATGIVISPGLPGLQVVSVVINQLVSADPLYSPRFDYSAPPNVTVRLYVPATGAEFANGTPFRVGYVAGETL